MSTSFDSSLIISEISTDGTYSNFTYVNYIGDRANSYSSTYYTNTGVTIVGGS